MSKINYNPKTATFSGSARGAVVWGEIPEADRVALQETIRHAANRTVESAYLEGLADKEAKRHVAAFEERFAVLRENEDPFMLLHAFQKWFRQYDMFDWRRTGETLRAITKRQNKLARGEVRGIRRHNKDKKLKAQAEQETREQLQVFIGRFLDVAGDGEPSTVLRGVKKYLHRLGVNASPEMVADTLRSMLRQRDDELGEEIDQFLGVKRKSRIEAAWDELAEYRDALIAAPPGRDQFFPSAMANDEQLEQFVAQYQLVVDIDGVSEEGLPLLRISTGEYRGSWALYALQLDGSYARSFFERVNRINPAGKDLGLHRNKRRAANA